VPAASASTTTNSRPSPLPVSFVPSRNRLRATKAPPRYTTLSPMASRRSGGVFDRTHSKDDRGVSGASALDDTDVAGVNFKTYDRSKLMDALAWWRSM
jgi:hypothetical protein